MLAQPKITKPQLTRLQTLWSQYARREIMAFVSGDEVTRSPSREARLNWASEHIKRTISSFSDLSSSEASALINLLQSEFGIAETSPSRAQRRYRSRIKDRDQAKAAGTEGRRGSHNKVTFATAEDIALIDQQLNLMGWNNSRLEAFLHSPSSPLGKRSSAQLRTLGDVNKVLWALKKIGRNAAREVRA